MTGLARVAVVVVLAVLGASLLTSCKPEPSTPPAPRPKTKVEPNPGAQPAAPAADPGPHNTETEAVVRVAWIGERGGTVQVSINHIQQAKQHVSPRKISTKYYGGLFEQTVNLTSPFPVTSIDVVWTPDAPRMPAQCAIQHLGMAVGEPHGVQSGPCVASWLR